MLQIVSFVFYQPEPVETDPNPAPQQEATKLADVSQLKARLEKIKQMANSWEGNLSVGHYIL